MPASFLADNLRFLRALVARPKNVGAVLPSGPVLARAIAHQVDPSREGPVLELGPGTGVISAALLERGIAAERLTLVEFDEDFARHNTTRFPGVHVIHGDAFNLDHTLGGRPSLPFAAIVSGLPLLNFPVAMRKRLMDGALIRLAPGAPFIQFSYGTHAPVVPPPGFSVVRAAMVWANIPPARVWVYRKA
jgi:phosphatidylethanolamine/phosphatidyl-N-methylethanolamine N-methyltransferase